MSIKNKYNRQPNEAPIPRGNRDVVSKLFESDTVVQEPVITEIQESANTEVQTTVSTETQIPVNTADRKVKKATFELDADLHKRLKSAAVLEDKTMVEIVEEALKAHLDK